MLFSLLILLASCSQDDNDPTPADEQPQAVTLTINLEDAYTRAISESADNTISRLLMQVIDNDTPGKAEELTLSDNQATKQLSLYASRSYTFLFWADDGKSYTYTDDLTNIALSGTPTGTQAEIAYAACQEWDKTATINVTLKHAVSKVTLKTTTSVNDDNTLTLTVPHAVTDYNVQTGTAIGTTKEYKHSITTSTITGATETSPKELFSFYVLAADELQTLTIESEKGETTVPANLSGGKHIILTGDIGSLTKYHEQPTAASITVTVGDWGDPQELPFGGKDELTDDTSASASLQGTGTETDPYRITSAADLKCYMNGGQYTANNKHALLYTNIEITAASDWDPASLYGTFDGGGHTISGTLNFSVTDTDNYIGLFNTVRGTVRNLNVTADITATGSITSYCYAGGIVASCQNGTIEHCTYSGDATVQVSVTGENSFHAGGIVGSAQNATVSYCKFSGTLDMEGSSVGDLGRMYVGGITGRKSAGTFTENDCSEGNPSTPAVGNE